MPGGGTRGQNLEHLRFFFSCRKLFVFEQQLLFRVYSLCDLGFSALGWGKHHALITRVGKLSLAQVGPYPTLLPYPTLPYPTQPPTLPYPTLPYHTLPYPQLYPTLPLPYPTPPHPTLPYPFQLAILPFKRKLNLSNRYC